MSTDVLLSQLGLTKFRGGKGSCDGLTFHPYFSFFQMHNLQKRTQIKVVDCCFWSSGGTSDTTSSFVPVKPKFKDVCMYVCKLSVTAIGTGESSGSFEL